MIDDLQTSEAWSRIYSHIQILDRDGWDRSDPNAWYEELISRKTFERRLAESTIRITSKPGQRGFDLGGR